jgi:hypothetical protein
VHVIKVDRARAGEPAVRLVDDDGQPVAEVDGFLRLLTVRGPEEVLVQIWLDPPLQLQMSS